MSGPSRSLHPAELALVEMAARLTSMELVERHRAVLDRLRAESAPVLAGVPGAALVVDSDGHVAAAKGISAPGRVVLPADLSPGEVRLAHLGPVVAEALPNGWLLRVAAEEGHEATAVVLDLRGTPEVRVSAPAARGRTGSPLGTPRSWWRSSPPGTRVAAQRLWPTTSSRTGSGW